MLTKQILSNLRRLGDYAVNGGISYVYESSSETGDELRFVVDRDWFPNFVDSNGLQILLGSLKKLGIVAPNVRTMWMGPRNDKTEIWCVTKGILATEFEYAPNAQIDAMLKASLKARRGPGWKNDPLNFDD